MKINILKFHYEEIIYVLNILASDLSKYKNDDLKNFAEAIHRLDDLSETEFLEQLKLVNARINMNIIENIQNLHRVIKKIYSSQWHKKLKYRHDVLDKSSVLAHNILMELHEKYIEPNEYAEQKMDVNW